MTTTLDEFRQQHADQMRDAEQQFDSIARRLADGTDDPTLVEIEETLRASGKSDADLLAAVNVHREREALRQSIRTYEQAASQRSELERKLADADAALEKAKAIHRETSAPLKIELARLKQLFRQASSARQALGRGCPDPDIERQIRLLSTRTKNKELEIQRVKRLIKDQESAISVNKSHGSNTAPMEERLKVNQSQLATLQDELQAFLDEERGIREQMIER